MRKPERPQADSSSIFVSRANKLQRDPLRRALLEALTRAAQEGVEELEASHGED